MSNKINQSRNIKSPSLLGNTVQSPEQEFKLPVIRQAASYNKQLERLKMSAKNAYEPFQNTKNSRIKRHIKSISSYNLIDYSLTSKMVKPEAPYHQKNKNQKTSILSTKVDFFDMNNQRRLKVSRNKSIQQMSGEKGRSKKAEIQIHRKSKDFMSAKLHYLLKNYLIKKETKDQAEEQYLVVGKSREQEPQEQQIEENQDGEQFRRRFHKWR